MSRISLQIDLYMIHEDQVFVANVVVTNPTQETVAISVISRPTRATAELNAIAKICKYRGLHKGHHFMPMAMEMHHAPGCDMDCFIRECAYLFYKRQSRSYVSLFFCIQFFRQCVNIAFQRALTYAIKRKIALAKDAYSRPPIIIKFHNLHANDIREVVGEIVSYNKRDQLSPFFGSYRLCVFWPFFGLPFCLRCDGSSHPFFF